ncbi:MAG: hypothetical protein KIT76_15290 [Pseudolabrys sp.]|nr:hypothetical protein [Pseudolabrys sp.]MCW5692401.1 hypothetical protein [Pseudolabrys sp.]
MRNVKHKATIVLVAAALVGSFWLGTVTQRPTQAAAPPLPSRAAVEPAAFIDMRPIVPAEIAEAARGKDALDTTSRTDW